MFTHGFAVLAMAVAFSVATVGCGSAKPPAKDGDKKNQPEVHPPGPHGGTLDDYGDGHAEVIIEQDKKTITVYLYDDDEDKLNPNPKVAKDFVARLMHLKPAVDIELKAEPLDKEKGGKSSSKYVGMHDKLADQPPWEVKLSGEMDGKDTSSPNIMKVTEKKGVEKKTK